MGSKSFCLLVSPVFNPGKGNLLMMVREQDPPLNLAMLASWIRDKGVETAILDCAIDAPTVTLFRDKLLQIIQKHKEKKIFIGFYVCTPTAYYCYMLAKIARELFPDCTLIAGGPHASFMYEEVLTLAPIDIAIIGEGEITLEEIIADKPLDTINGLAYKDKTESSIKVTASRARIEDINNLPMPAYDLLKIRKYRPPVGTFKRLPSFMVTFSRGCPNNCFFCTKTLGFKHYQKSSENIFKEIKYLFDTFGIKDFVFVDDTFTAYRDNTIAFCKLLIENKLKISWHCYTRVNTIDKELIGWMKKAGCHQLMFGVESFSPEVLTLINKDINLQQIEAAVKMTRQAGIACRLSMMIGNRGDTAESLKHSLKELLRLQPDFISVLIATPGPGTPFFEWADKENRILTRDWSLYTGGTPVVRLEGISSEEISCYYKLYWKKFYFYPGSIWRLLKYTTNIYQAYSLMVGFLRVMKFMIVRR